MKRRVAIHTLGCRANQYDGESLEDQLVLKGYEIVPFEKEADVYVVNTCTVTQAADKEARRLIRRAHCQNPKAKIIATGCYAQVSPKELSDIEGLSYIIGNDRKGELVLLIERLDGGEVPPLPSHLNTLKRSRAYVKIQDGCNFRCSFCIIPYARGESRSRPIPDIIEEIKQLRDHGYHEAVLTGIHIGSYGWDLKPKTDLFHLIQALAKAKPMTRIRLSTLDPDEVSREMIDLMSGNDLFCPHLHIAIQSGDDLILKKMRRRHTTRQLFRMTHYAVKKISDLGMGADIITGFPGETEEQHRWTRKVLEDLPLSYLHVFPYSERKRTPAASYSGAVPVAIRKERAGELIALGAQKKTEFWERQIGKTRPAILERAVDAIWHKAVTDNFIPIWLPRQKEPRGVPKEILLEKIENGKVVGTCRSMSVRKSV